MSYRPRTRVWSCAAVTDSAVSLDALREHMRITSTDEDDLLALYGAAATARVERRTQRLLSVRQAVLRLQNLPSGTCMIDLPGGAVSSITSVVADGNAITGCTAVGDSPAVLVPASDWPVIVGTGYPVVITYQVGYSAVPLDLIQAILLIAGDLFERRTNSDEKPSYAVEISAERLMESYVIRSIA